MRTFSLLGLGFIALFLAVACSTNTDDGSDTLEPNLVLKDLLVSQRAGRTNPTFLDASWVSGTVYVFTKDTADLRGVNFYVDDPERSGPAFQREKWPPFDLRGGSAEAANAFDTNSLSDGVHTITAELVKADSAKIITATFLVDNSGDWRNQPLVSPFPERTEAEKLEGATVTGDMYSFLVPGQAVQKIAFYLDGTLHKTEQVPFYDAASTEYDGLSSPLDTTTLADGQHTLRAVLTTTAGQQEARATFTVANEAPQADPGNGVGLDERPSNSTCVAPARPQATLSLERRFRPQIFSALVGLKQAPGSASHWYALEKSGRLLRFPDQDSVDDGEVETVIDLRATVNDSAEGGLLGLAFHPAFASNGYVFLSYTYGGMRSRIARFTSPDGGKRLDPGSEKVILEVDQPYGNHNGGDIAFGPDGHLYIALGDGGSGGDPEGNGQNTNTLLGSILRLDVDGGDPYSIPADNPFANGGGAKEIYAYGFRNPWRMSFDRQTGKLWAGDVGQASYEEVDVVEKGKNYGWNIREGRHCYSGDCNAGGLTDPVHEYDHGEGKSVTGGYVYRGTQLEDLQGSYIYGDFASGNVWALEPDNGFKNRKLLSSSLSISSFAEDHAGELYVVDYGGKIYQLVAGGSAVSLPEKLSQTGCVDSQDPTRMARGVIPYEVALPFWSDGAEKNRWFALPDGSNFTVNAEGDWELPPGGVSIKEFHLGGKRLETRFFVRHGDGSYSGYTYEWNDAQTEATLLTEGKTKDVSGQTWVFPSSSECISCHTAAAGHSLGLQTRQLNRQATYPSTGRTAGQLGTLKHVGILPSSTEELKAFPTLGETSLPKTERAQAYLDVNCSNCHRPGGLGRGDLDLRASTPLSESETCNVDPIAGDLGVSGAKVIAPGDKAKSLLWLRLSRRDASAMPPLGSTVHDQRASAFLGGWIDGLSGCP